MTNPDLGFFFDNILKENSLFAASCVFFVVCLGFNLICGGVIPASGVVGYFSLFTVVVITIYLYLQEPMLCLPIGNGRWGGGGGGGLVHASVASVLPFPSPHM